MTNFIIELLYKRTFVVVNSDGQTSRPQWLKNGVPHGSILATSLYNIYTSDFPQQLLIVTAMYADDIALNIAASIFMHVEDTPFYDMDSVQNVPKRWRLKLS